MPRNSGFSPREWNRAPQYTSPGDTPGVTVLDFRELTRLAREEEASGAFRAADDDGTLAKAPFFLDDLPAAFYRVGAFHPDFTPNHNTSDPETIVVMQGALRVVHNGWRERTAAESLVDPVNCLAVAMYRDFDDGGLRPDFRIAR